MNGFSVADGSEGVTADYWSTAPLNSTHTQASVSFPAYEPTEAFAEYAESLVAHYGSAFMSQPTGSLV
jgi:hypothetical protein